MQPSSLIFVAVIGIWAAFLVQHWVRRREDLATARSLDRFSDAMRVLDRRPVIAAPTPRPSLAVREAAEGHHAKVSSPPATSAPASPLIARSSQRATVTPPDSLAGVTRTNAPLDTRPRPARRASRRPVPRRTMVIRRAWALLGGLAMLALPVVGVLAFTDVIARWLPVVPVLALVLAVGALRMAAVRERTSRHTGAQLARARTASAPGRADQIAAARPATRSPRPAPAAAPSETSSAAAVESVAIEAPEMPDTQGVPDEHERVAPTAPAIAPVRPAVVAFADFGVDPATVEISHPGLGMPWSPVAVPPPTYTLKDKAPALPPVAPPHAAGSEAGACDGEDSSLEMAVPRAVGD